jgi:hypothetical protein
MIAVLASGSGALLAWASTVHDLPTPPADSTVRELDAWDAPPPLPYVWSPADLDWIVPPAPTPPRLSRLAFQSRYTLAEQVAIELAASDQAPSVSATDAATLRVFDRALSNATDVDVTDPRTIAGVEFHASLGLIAPARVAEILTAPI